MDPFDFAHNIKAEKANAQARYRIYTNITKAVQLIEAFVAVALISWSSTRLPSVFKFSGDYLFSFTSYLMNQHVVFLVGNIIVFLCYVLSRFTTDSGNESLVSGTQYHGVRHEDLNIRKPVPDSPTPTLVPLQVTEPQVESRALVIPNKISNEKEIPNMVTEPKLAAVTAIKQAEKEIERFRRTQSDLKSKISTKPHSELRRSVTKGKRRRTVAFGELESMVESSPAVDKLSDEEFRIAVETFISKQQRLIKQQSMIKGES